MGLETLSVLGVTLAIEWWIGKTDKIKANSIPEATIERFAKAAVKVAIGVAKKI